MTTDLSKTPGNTANRYHDGSRRIGHLLRACFPPAVIGFIIAVIVLSSDGKSRWLFPHISQKILELQPSFANLDAAPTVTAESGFCRVSTATDHCPPRMVSGAVLSANMTSMAMRYVTSSHGLQFQATARLGCSVTEVALPHRNPGLAASTITKDTGNNFTIWAYFIRCVLGGDKSSKSLADEIYSGRHGIGSFNVVFSGGRPATTGAHCDLKDVGFNLT